MDDLVDGRSGRRAGHYPRYCAVDPEFAACSRASGMDAILCGFHRRDRGGCDCLQSADRANAEQGPTGVFGRVAADVGGTAPQPARHRDDRAHSRIFAVWGTASNGGPFARSNLNDSFLLLLAFMISISVPSLALSADVATRKRHEDHIEFVLRELSHRSKNLLAVVQGMARQVARQTENFKDFDAAFSTRLRAFADTHDLLITRSWRGTDIRDLVRTQLIPFIESKGDRLTSDGPSLMLTPKASEQIGLALHELGTNAAKHGAFSVPTGTVTVRWQLENDGPDKGHLRIGWMERGGPAVNGFQTNGFGYMMITKIVPLSLQGRASLELESEGLRWTLVVPANNVLAND